MKHQTNPPDPMELELLKAVDQGLLESEDGVNFKLSEKGQQDAEKLMLYSADALEMHFKLTPADLRKHGVSSRMRQLVADMFDQALAQSRAKDEVIKQLLARIEAGNS